MNKEQIENINKKCPYEQGIFVQPYGIPVHIKEPVIYTRYELGGMQGGSCWDGCIERYTEDPPKNRYGIIDLVLEELMPEITYLQYKKIETLIHDNYETQYEYYGNSTDYKIEYIIVSELEELLNKIKNT